jgi:hypothetical protein
MSTAFLLALWKFCGSTMYITGLKHKKQCEKPSPATSTDKAGRWRTKERSTPATMQRERAAMEASPKFSHLPECTNFQLKSILQRRSRLFKSFRAEALMPNPSCFCTPLVGTMTEADHHPAITGSV